MAELIERLNARRSDRLPGLLAPECIDISNALNNLAALNATPAEPDQSNSEESGAMAKLPTGKVSGVVSLNVLRSTLEMMGFPDWRKRFESWPEVPSLRLRCGIVPRTTVLIRDD